MTISKRDLEKALKFIDDDAKETFLGMTREEQLIALLSIEASNSNRLAVVEKRQIDFEHDIHSYREKRERRESNEGDDIMSTTQKILKAISEADAKKFDVWAWFRDRVLPGIISLITLAILYLTFGGKMP